MKLENTEHHKYFCSSVFEITKQVGLKYSYEDIEKKVIDEDYFCCFENVKKSRWHLGIWAVGQWNLKFKSLVDGTLYDAGYDVSGQKPLTICVFIIHEWEYDKFRPSYANWVEYIEKDRYERDMKYIVRQLNSFFKFPVHTYHETIASEYDDEKDKNMYMNYLRKIWEYEYVPAFEKYRSRFFGFINMCVLVICAKLDPRVNHVRHHYHADRWNSEFQVAVVFKYQTPWKDWKIYNDYWHTLLFYRENCELSMDYCEDDEEFDNKFWRGVWWDKEPDKDEQYTFTEIPSEESEYEENNEIKEENNEQQDS